IIYLLFFPSLRSSDLSVAKTAIPLCSRKLRPYPVFTVTISSFSPSFLTSCVRITSISASSLFQAIGYVRKDCNMPCTLDSLSNFPLILQGSPGNPAGQYLTLFVYKLCKEIRILVVNVFDTVLFKTAVFFTVVNNLGRCNVLNLFLSCHYAVSPSFCCSLDFLVVRPARLRSL